MRPIRTSPTRSTPTRRALSLAVLLAAPVLALASPAAAQDKAPDPAKDPARDTAASEVYRGHGIALHGKPGYSADFTHFKYIDPNAPKGGEMRVGEIGTFDSVNPYVIKGNAAVWVGFLVHGNLMVKAEDEPFTVYGWIAKSIALPKDRSWVEFELDPRAKFSDGSPITVDDVIFSFNILRTKGLPFFRFYFNDVIEVKKTAERTVRFVLKKTDNKELPLIIAGDLPILSKAYWEKRDFEKSTLDIPVASGPYRIQRVVPGRTMIYERIKDYWAKDLPTIKGHYNFDIWRADYYLDATVAREALKAGEYDYRLENTASAWATAYNTDDVKSGLFLRKTIEHHRPAGMQGFAFNLRRKMFQDPRTRQALAYAFDFEWTNKNLFYGQYKRTKSYFDNSDMAATGLPTGRTKEILEKFRGKIPDTVFTTPYKVPTYDGSGQIRSGLREALKLLRAAGWKFKGRQLVDAEGKPFKFEILLSSPAFERIVLPFARNLKRIGIQATVRVVDQSQYINRVRRFDFDMIVMVWGQSESPGNEQREMWSSAAAKRVGSRNYVGIQDPVIDQLVEMVIAAPDRKELVARVKALDYVLLHHHYVIPQWHLNADRFAVWDKFGWPPGTELRGIRPWMLWVDPKKAARLRDKLKSEQ